MEALEGLVTINGADIWKEYGAFLTEEKKGGRENLTTIMTPSKAKAHVGVDIRERDGVKYSDTLEVRNQEREVTLHFAIFAPTRRDWLARYRAFITMLKQGDGGWLTFSFPSLDMTMRMFYVSCPGYRPLTYLWNEGVHAGRFKVTFKEPEPTF